MTYRLPVIVCLMADDDDDDDVHSTLKLARSYLSLAHSAKVKTGLPEKNEKQLQSVESSGGWKGRRTTGTYGEKDFWKR